MLFESLLGISKGKENHCNRLKFLKVYLAAVLSPQISSLYMFFRIFGKNFIIDFLLSTSDTSGIKCLRYQEDQTERDLDLYTLNNTRLL